MAFSSRPIVIGNWKMNGLKIDLAELQRVREAVGGVRSGRPDLAFCLPATLIAQAAELLAGTGVAVGGQCCHAATHGAHTGDISAAMLKDAGATLVLAGHSERRADCHESDADVHAQAVAASRAGLTAVICVGETRAERDAGETLRVIGRQVDESVPRDAHGSATILAYEPVWAIGTGLTPTAADVAEVHAFIRRRLVSLLPNGGADVRILYGGSVKAGNAAELLAIDNVDGALVGGASLKAQEFLGIAAVYR